MINKTVTYENFDGEVVTEVLNFHLGRSEAVKLLNWIPRMEALQRKVNAIQAAYNEALKVDPQTPVPEMQPADIVEMLEVMKVLIKASYGVREGNKFRQNEVVWDDFKDTPAYDTFLFGLFENPAEGNDFMEHIFPRYMQEEATKAAGERIVQLPPEQSVTTAPVPLGVATPENNDPAWVREGRVPAKHELNGATPDQIELAFKRRMQAAKEQASEA